MVYLIKKQEYAIAKDTKEINSPNISIIDNGSLVDVLKCICGDKKLSKKIKDVWMEFLAELDSPDCSEVTTWLDYDGLPTDERFMQEDNYVCTQYSLTVSKATKEDLNELYDELTEEVDEINHLLSTIEIILNNKKDEA